MSDLPLTHEFLSMSASRHARCLPQTALTCANSRSPRASTRSRKSSIRRATTQCAFRNLQGLVSKRRDFPYRSGTADWVKVKCLSWREANKDRHELFKKRK